MPQPRGTKPKPSTEPAPLDPKWQRAILGILALLLLASAGVMMLLLRDEASQIWLSGCMRVGLVLAALWLAHPHLDRLPNPLVLLIVVGAVVVAFVRWKQMIPVLIGLLVVLMLLRSWKPAGKKSR